MVMEYTLLRDNMFIIKSKFRSEMHHTALLLNIFTNTHVNTKAFASLRTMLLLLVQVIINNFFQMKIIMRLKDFKFLKKNNIFRTNRKKVMIPASK